MNSNKNTEVCQRSKKHPERKRIMLVSGRYTAVTVWANSTSKFQWSSTIKENSLKKVGLTSKVCCVVFPFQLDFCRWATLPKKKRKMDLTIEKNRVIRPHADGDISPDCAPAWRWVSISLSWLLWGIKESGFISWQRRFWLVSLPYWTHSAAVFMLLSGS